MILKRRPVKTDPFFAVIGLQLDRGNLGNAATDNLMKDIGITQNEYNNGST